MFTETELAIIQRLKGRLREGMVHPGDPERGIPATPIMLPFKSIAGRPQEMDDLLDQSAELLAEMIVFTIREDEDVEFTPRADAAAMRVAAGDDLGVRNVPMFCRCDKKMQAPLAVITVTDPDRLVINGPQLLRGLHQREVACPHNPITK